MAEPAGVGATSIRVRNEQLKVGDHNMVEEPGNIGARLVVVVENVMGWRRRRIDNPIRESLGLNDDLN